MAFSMGTSIAMYRIQCARTERRLGRGYNVAFRIIYDDPREIRKLAFLSHEYVFLPNRLSTAEHAPVNIFRLIRLIAMDSGGHYFMDLRQKIHSKLSIDDAICASEKHT
ncbi:hypothetical protein QQP08_023772 [Theobroma cacao]|nr:hypothetical protein QQP08_023772 [Theobroma cacao]